MCALCVSTYMCGVWYPDLDVEAHQESSGYALYKSLLIYVAHLDLVGVPVQGTKWVDGLNLDTAALRFAPWEVTQIQGCFPSNSLAEESSGNTVRAVYMSTSTRNDGYGTPVICLTLM